jgi:serine/threonine protein kinase
MGRESSTAISGRFDARGDIYAIGIAIFELFYGMRWMVEYSGPEAIEILLQNNFELPLDELKDIPKKYRYIIKKCTALSVDQRFQSAAEVIEAFKKPLDYTFVIDDKVALKQSTHVIDDTVRSRGMVESMSYSTRPNIVIKLIMVAISSSIIMAMTLAGSLAIPSVRGYVVKQAYVYRNSISPKIYDLIMRLPVPGK